MLPINRPVRVVTTRRQDDPRPPAERGHLHRATDRREERLVSLVKADLREYELGKTSPMPSRREKLTADEVADVVAYLLSLKGQSMSRTLARSRRLLHRAGRCRRVSYRSHAQVTSDRIAARGAEPQNWLTYNGSYSSQRYSTLNQITPANVKQPRDRSGCCRTRCSAPGSRRRWSSTASCTSRSGRTT